jgi:uncharacterized membrane protein
MKVVFQPRSKFVGDVIVAVFGIIFGCFFVVFVVFVVFGIVFVVCVVFGIVFVVRCRHHDSPPTC